MENLRPYALIYLNDWFRVDERFVKGFSSNSRSERLTRLYETAKEYGITRNFPGSDESRFKAALDALDDMPKLISEDSVDLHVETLTNRFAKTYKKRLLSAASKLLWFRNRSPVVILDERAVRYLKKLHGKKFDSRNYGAYRAVWNSQFNQREAAIRLACAELQSVKHFSLRADISNEELRRLTGSK